MSFQPARLELARKYRNLNMTELASRLQVTRQAVSKYMSGNGAPIEDVYFRLITQLGFPKTFYEQEKLPQYDIGNTFFRALASTTLKDIQTQEIKTMLVAEIYHFLQCYLGMPELNVLHFDVDETSPEEAANALRAHWGLDDQPIDNMVALLESKGIVVSSFTVGTKTIDAFTQVHCQVGQEDQFVVILGNDTTMVRRQFSAAHELGHIVLHNNLPNLKDLETDVKKRIEDQANNFAAAFLLPCKGFHRDLIFPHKLEPYMTLKKKWRVSIAAMIMRAKQLDAISSSQYEYLWRQYNGKGREWRTKGREPYDDVWAVPQPQLFKKAVTILVEQGILTPEEYMQALENYGYALEPKEVEHLLDLEEGTLAIKNETPQAPLELNIKQG